MTFIRRVLITAGLASALAGFASASSIEAFETEFPLSGSNPNTDFNYTLTLPDFNVAGATLTGVTIYLFAGEQTTNISIANVGQVAQTNFDIDLTSNIASNLSNPLTNSATGNKVYNGLTLTVFDANNLNLGPGTGTNAVGACPTGTPSTSCSSVTFPNSTDNIIKDPNGNNPPNNTNLDGFTIATGALGLTGAVLNDSANLGDYIGSGTFTLSGATFGSSTISGASSISGTVISTGDLAAEVDYTYTVPGNTPEPTTMFLMGGALVGLGLIGKRLKKS